MASGAALLQKLARQAVTRLLASGQHPTLTQSLFTPEERQQLAHELAAVTTTASLLGRSLVADHAGRVRRRQQRRVKEGQSVALDVPEVLQSTDYSCGAACLRAVLDYHGVEAGEGELAELLGTSPAAGTSPEAIQRLSRRLGLETEARTGASLDDLAAALARNAPCICAVQRNTTGHWVVVIGIDAGQVHLMDPLDGLCSQSAELFTLNWWDESGGKRYDRFALAVGAPMRESRLHRVLESGPVPPFAPDEALDFFRALVPVLGTDPHLLPNLQRTAFTLAAATEQELLQAVQAAILQRLATGEVGTGRAAVQAVLDAAGVGSQPGYAETVFRTNAVSSYNQGTHEQLQREAETFPVWRYSNPDDNRSRPKHAALNGTYYPASVSLDQVRGATLADKANCRCVQLPVDKWEWADLRAGGARIAPGFPDVLAGLQISGPAS